MRRAAILLALAFCASARAAADPYITPEMDKWLMEGIDSIYDMRFDDAEAAAKRAIALNPEHPNAYMGLAGVAWTRYVYGSDQSDQTLLKPYEDATNKAIVVGEAWIQKHPNDPMGLMTLGAAYGLSSRLMCIRRQWVNAYWTGRTAVKLTRQAVKTDPNFWDAYLGVGMYDYYTDVYPRFIGVLAKLVLGGNRLRGIEALKLVAERGHYSQNNAKILLVEIYLEDQWGARDAEKAVELTKELRARYPNSAMMHSAQFVALYEAQHYPDVVKCAQEYIGRVKSGKYNPIQLSKGYVALAVGLWAQKKYDQALEAFKVAEQVRYDGKLSRWAVWAHIRAGNLEDSLGRRLDAIKDYRAAAAEPDLWDFRKFAKAGLSKPFRSVYPGPIDPP